MQTLDHARKDRAFLGVERSITGRRWVERLDAGAARLAQTIAQRHGTTEIVARILAGRGIDADSVPDFLDPALKRLMPDPSVLTGMDAAAERIADAVTAGEAITIFGDYDVDGATSAALLSRYLRAVGVDAAIYIPDRIFEGYGPNPEAMAKLAAAGTRLVVCVDCGSTSFDALAEAGKLGLGVVVIDHHQVGDDLPPAEAVVNPNRQDDLSGLGYLAAVGVTFLTAVAVNRILRGRGHFGASRREPDLLQWLDLVALGTVCDVVPLVGLNRAFVSKGLRAMARRENPGLAALADVSRLGGPPSPYHLGFVLGPRINAGGRIGDAALGARLLASDDPAESEAIAVELDRLNRERQALETAMLEEAVAEAEAEIGSGEGPAVLVTASETWHPGVVGLIASRLKDRFQRPAVAVGIQPNGLGAGSGRSVPGIDLGRLVRRAVEEGILVKGGGHAMAAGLTVERSRLGDLRGFLADQASSIAGGDAVGSLAIDAALAATGATVDLIGLVEQAGPFGTGHPEPVFAFPMHRLGYVETIGNGHVRAALKSPDGTALKAMAFRAADTELGRALLDSRGQALHVAGTLSVDRWQGRTQPSLRIIDAAPG
ncbi:MAG: single-stranded-DNA-specific exonuclease RecJ [Bauldia sp.]|nr:single-stranded-DNA-specific exonuclease RecJ [Bauldia sp.]